MYHFSRVPGGVSALVALFLAAASLDAAVPSSVTFPNGGIALDQPRVEVELFEGPEPGAVSLGPAPEVSTFLLDTGASGGLIAEGQLFELAYGTTALDSLKDNGYTNAGTAMEIGVAGPAPMDVSEPYTLKVDTLDQGASVQVNNMRFLSQPGLDLQSFAGIIGMPAMIGRKTTFDMTEFASLSRMGVSFEPPSGSRNAVDRGMLPTGPAPTNAPLPFLEVRANHGGQSRVGDFLFDTGAQLSILSPRIAKDIGLDENGDGDFDEEQIQSLTVGGIGGQVQAPMLNVDSITLTGDDGTDVNITDLQMLVIDIHPEIEGILGSDFLTSGWTEAVLGDRDEGFINTVEMDLTDLEAEGELADLAAEAGQMTINLSDEIEGLDQPLSIDMPIEMKEFATIPEPGSALLLMGGGFVLVVRRRRRPCP
jgi:hypothetical protein